MLEFSSQIDKFIKHSPNFCTYCGKGLSGAVELLVEKRQVFDIPPIQLECTEHQVFSKRCICVYSTQSPFPESVKARVQYGSNTEALIGYLNARTFPLKE